MSHVTREFIDALLHERGTEVGLDCLSKRVIQKRIGKKRLSKLEDPFFNDIKFGKELKEIPKEYMKDVMNFVNYLAVTKDKKFVIKGRDLETGEDTTKEIPYVHRWTDIYKKSILAKLYQLEDFLGYDLQDVTMITLTTYQKGISPENALFKLKESYTKLIDCMRKAFGTIDYYYVLEPHKTGYTHMHILYCKILRESDKNYIRSLWSRKYEAAAFDHGINFAEPNGSEKGDFAAGSVARVRGYLMKYVSKSVYNPNAPEESYHGVNGSFGMKKYELLFNSLLKKHNIRLWNCSRHFSQIMKQKKDEDRLKWECTEVIQYYKEDFVNVIWNKETGSHPDIVKSWVIKCVSSFLTKFDEKDIQEGRLKAEYKDKKYYIFEPVWVPVGCV